MYFDKDILTQIRDILHIRMGTWDELCILCGVAPSGGCSNLAAKYGLDKEAKTIADEIKPGDEETLKVVQAMLEATFSEESENEGPSYRHPWMAEGLGYGQYNEMLNIAVGYFNEAGECDTRDGRIPDGKHVQVRVVDNVNGGDFDEVVHRVDGEEKRTDDLSICSVGYDHNPNFALCEPCYHYLEAWLARDQLPPRSCGFPSDPAPLPFASELYEIVNSQEKRRAEGSGLLPAIDYAGIEDTLEQWQDYFTPARRGVKHLREAIEAGLRGADLIPALLKDCRAYMFMRPNMYPVPPKINRTPTFTLYHPSHNAIMPAIGNLPNELLLPILHDLPLPSLLALASTCRSLRAFILEPSFLDRILKESITRGSLRWLMPVEPVLREHKRAYDTLRLWFAEDHRPEPSPEEPEPAEEDSASEAGDEDEDGERDAVEADADADAPRQRAVEHKPIPPVKPLVMSPHFPRLAFVRECLASDSMRNRRRLWGQVAQFEALWRDYRLHGWRVNRFYPSSEMQRNPQEQSQ